MKITKKATCKCSLVSERVLLGLRFPRFHPLALPDNCSIKMKMNRVFCELVVNWVN